MNLPWTSNNHLSHLECGTEVWVLVVKVVLGALAAWELEVLVALGALAAWVLEVLVELAAERVRVAD
jgi:hypothetical protein